MKPGDGTAGRRRVRASAISLALMFVGLISGCGGGGRFSQEVPEFAVLVAETSGDADCRLGSGVEWARSEAEQVIPREGAIRTGADGDVWLDLPSGGISHVAKESLLEVLDLDRSDAGVDSSVILRLLQGVGFFRWSPGGASLQVETPHVQAAVLGTEFVLEVKEGSTRIIVSKGRVELLGQDRSLVINEGHQSITRIGEPPGMPEPVRLIAAQGLAGELERFGDRAGNLRNRRTIDRR